MSAYDNRLFQNVTSDNKVPQVDSAHLLASASDDRILVAQNLESGDRTAALSKRDTWKPDRIFLGIDVTGSMSDQPLAGMSQLSLNCAGDKQSMLDQMKADSRSKLDQLKDVLETFVSGLDDIKTLRGRIFGLSVDGKTHEAYFDAQKKNAEQTGILFGDGQETLSRRQIAERIRKLQPKGPATAVANAIDQCRIDAEQSGSTSPLLVLWTDGQENCGGNVCKEIEKFADEFKNGRIVVFGLDPTVKDQFDCVGLKAMGDRFKFVEATDPNKSLEVLGKMSNQSTQANLVNREVTGKLRQEELRGNALPFKQVTPPGFYGEIFGEILQKRK